MMMNIVFKEADPSTNLKVWKVPTAHPSLHRPWAESEQNANLGLRQVMVPDAVYSDITILAFCHAYKNELGQFAASFCGSAIMFDFVGGLMENQRWASAGTTRLR